jgi:hypothetical protein
MLGLNDHFIPRHPPVGFGKGPIGHELGDGDYVLRRGPDIVAFCGSVGYRNPCFISGRQMAGDSRFREGYRLVRIDHGGKVGEMYFKLEGGPIGVRRTPEGVTVPGYFFAGEGPARAALVDGYTLVARIRPEEAGVARFTLDAGIWRFTFAPMLNTSERVLGLACDGRSARHTGGAHGTLRLSQRSEVHVAVGIVGTAPTWDLDHLFLKRSPEREAEWTCEGDERVPVLAALAEVARPQPEHTFWAAPGNRLFGTAGLLVQLPGSVRLKRIGLSVDGNDRYAVRYLRRETVVGEQEVRPRIGGYGLAVWELDVPQEIAEGTGVDQIQIQPIEGDNAYSLGHLVLLDDAGSPAQELLRH